MTRPGYVKQFANLNMALIEIVDLPMEKSMVDLSIVRYVSPFTRPGTYRYTMIYLDLQIPRRNGKTISTITMENVKRTIVPP